MKNAVASNWVAETCVATDTGFTLQGTTKGYTSFSDAFSAGDQVFYSVHDSNGNREAGYATFDGRALIGREPTATLFNNVYSKSSVSKLDFSGELTIACTFNAAAFNVLWRALDSIDPDGDGNINIPPELIDGLLDKLDTKAEQADLEQEIQDRIGGDKALQDQIDAIDPDGDRSVDWDEIQNKPTEFPPEAHNQGWDTITGKPADYPPSTHGHAWGEIADKPSEFPPEAHNQDWSTITNKPSEFPPEAHNHGQDEVDGLEDRLTQIEGSISGGGGFVDAPNDGELYGRQSEAWAVVPTGSSSLWEQNGSNIYYNDGSVGIGTDAPAHPLEVISNGTALNDRSVRINSDRAKNVIGFGSSSGAGVNLPNVGVDGTNFVVDNGGITRLTIDTSGDATFSGKVLASNVGSETNACGLRFSAASDGGASTRVVPTDTSSVADGVVDIGSASGRFKDAHFSGTVNANNIKGEGDRAGFLFDGSKRIIPTENGSASSGQQDLGSTANKFKDAHFSETVNALTVSARDFGQVSSGAGIRFTQISGTPTIRPVSMNTDPINIASGELDLGDNNSKFKNGWFSDTLHAGTLSLRSGRLYDTATNGVGMLFSPGANGAGSILPTDASGNLVNIGPSLGSSVRKWNTGHFNDTVSVGEVNVATNRIWRAGYSGFQFTDSIRPLRGDGTQSDGELSLGTSDQKFKDGWFSGTVNAGNLVIDGGNSFYRASAGAGGLKFTTLNSIIPTDNTGTNTDGELSLGSNASQRFKDAYFSGTVDAAGFTVNGVPIGGGASGNFVDKDTTTAQTIKSTLTGPDFIASSDERLKDNITTAPVGLIDSLKGREWDWKESGEKGSGVIAQELEEVLPHLVHEDESGMKSVSYMGLCAYLIEEVKALRAEVEALK